MDKYRETKDLEEVEKAHAAEVARLRKDLRLVFEERDKARAEVVRLRKMCAKYVPPVTDMAGVFKNCHSLTVEVEVEVERLRRLCTDRPMLHVPSQERDDWRDKVDAAGRGEGE